MSKHGWRDFLSAVGAGLIVVGLVAWSILARVHDASRPWTPDLHPDWFQVVIGAVGLVGLFWTVIFARKAWLAAQQGAEEAKRSADAAYEALADTRKDAAEQAERFSTQLGVAVAANSAFSESSERQLRAYVSLRKIHLDKRQDGRMGVLSRWENSGQTPTCRAVAQIGFEFRSDDLPADFDYPDTAAGPPQPQNLGAGQSRKTGGLELGVYDQGRLVRKESRLFVWGWFEYSDVFEGTSRHRSEFCIEVLAIDNTIEIIGKNYGPHNGTDGDCLKAPQTS